MSTYNKQTVHPITKKVENATWYDDFFGQHNYGVAFPSDGKVFRADEFDWEENPLTMALEGKPRANPDVVPLTIKQSTKIDIAPYPSKEGEAQIIKEQNGEEGHESVTTKHPDGHRDVQINVKRLDIKNRTPEDTIAEGKIIDRLYKEKVGVFIVNKLTNEHCYFISPLPEVQSRSEAVIEKAIEKWHCQTSDFLIIKVAPQDASPQVIAL